MSYDREVLRRILQKTRNKCHLCHRRLNISCYGSDWHVDHSIPRAAGGSDHLNNLFAACVGCNCGKRDGSNRVARTLNGKKRSPLSHKEYSNAVAENTLAGGCVGALGGALLLGPFGFWAGMLIGGLLGNDTTVKG